MQLDASFYSILQLNVDHLDILERLIKTIGLHPLNHLHYICALDNLQKQPYASETNKRPRNTQPKHCKFDKKTLTRPKTVCLLSSHGVGTVVMKNLQKTVEGVDICRPKPSSTENITLRSN